jgi:hypothetical protein
MADPRVGAKENIRRLEHIMVTGNKELLKER